MGTPIIAIDAPLPTVRRMRNLSASTRLTTIDYSQFLTMIRANDPSAGSPTETLLRLLLPRDFEVHSTFRSSDRNPNTAAVRSIHRKIHSVGATGGVYKGQGRNQHELMTRAY